MGLTWDDFLELAAIVTDLYDSIGYFKTSNVDIKEKNYRVFAAAQNYQEFFGNLKCSEFMKQVRIS